MVKSQKNVGKGKRVFHLIRFPLSLNLLLRSNVRGNLSVFLVRFHLYHEVKIGAYFLRKTPSLNSENEFLNFEVLC